MDSQAPGRPLGPWLTLLCGLLLLWSPVSLALVASTLVDTLPVRPASVSAILGLRLLVAGLGIAAGLALLGRRPGAVRVTVAALVASLGADLLVYLTPWFPNNRLPGTTPLYVGASLTYHLGWLAYLSGSKRVRSL